MKKTLSVIIPVYNSAHTALHAVNSVLNQSWGISEIIIIDDGSTDDSFRILHEKYIGMHNIRVYSIENSGVAEARNFGISKASSEWVAFLDSDDIWHLDKLKLQINFLESDSQVGFIGCLTNIHGLGIFKFFNHYEVVFITLNMLLFKNYFQPSTVIIKKLILDDVGCFPSGRRYAEEGDLFMRIAKNHKCVLLNKVLVNYSHDVNNPSSLSSKVLEMEMGELNNIISVYKRRDTSLFIISIAIIFSLIKFLRRLFLKFFTNVFY